MHRASHFPVFLYVWLTAAPLKRKGQRVFDVMAKEEEDHFRGGKRFARDRNYGISNKAFWRWWHKQEKDKHGGDDLDRDTAWSLFDWWQKAGSPES